MEILVVDDDEGTRRLLTRWLTRLGHRAHDADSAEIGVRMARENIYDAVLLDYQMPRHDALWFMKQVRLPVTATSGRISTSNAQPRSESTAAWMSALVLKTTPYAVSPR